MNEEETIISKRARNYLGSSEDRCITASPFFTSKSSETEETTTAEPVGILADVFMEENSLLVEEPENIATADESENQPERPTDEVAHTAVEILDRTAQQRQVSESPPSKKPLKTTENDNQEVIPSSPIPIRPSLLQFLYGNPPTPSLTDPKPQTPPLDTSPPPSRPVFIPLPSQRIATPILRPGMKKAYTPRPSNVTFPDTPTLTPRLSAQQSHLVNGWKERFLRTEEATPTSHAPRLTNTISTRPVTPLHTPLFSRHNLGPR